MNKEKYQITFIKKNIKNLDNVIDILVAHKVELKESMSKIATPPESPYLQWLKDGTVLYLVFSEGVKTEIVKGKVTKSDYGISVFEGGELCFALGDIQRKSGPLTCYVHHYFGPDLPTAYRVACGLWADAGTVLYYVEKYNLIAYSADLDCPGLWIWSIVSCRIKEITESLKMETVKSNQEFVIYAPFATHPALPGRPNINLADCDKLTPDCDKASAYLKSKIDGTEDKS